MKLNYKFWYIFYRKLRYLLKKNYFLEHKTTFLDYLENCLFIGQIYRQYSIHFISLCKISLIILLKSTWHRHYIHIHPFLYASCKLQNAQLFLQHQQKKMNDYLKRITRIVYRSPQKNLYTEAEMMIPSSGWPHFGQS